MSLIELLDELSCVRAFVVIDEGRRCVRACETEQAHHCKKIHRGERGENYESTVLVELRGLESGTGAENSPGAHCFPFFAVSERNTSTRSGARVRNPSTVVTPRASRTMSSGTTSVAR